MPHFADMIVQDVIDGRRAGLTREQRRHVIEHIAAAPFSGEVKQLREWARLLPDQFVGQPHPSHPDQTLREDTELTSAEYHALKHTFDDGWRPGTTTNEYVNDIRTAVRAATLFDVGRDRVTYPGRRERMAQRAATRTDVQALVSTKVRALAGACVFVMYDPERAKILSGYRLPGAAAERRLTKWTPRYTL